MANTESNYGMYPVVPIRNTIVVPNTITPLLVGRKASIRAAESALSGNNKVLCVTQKTNVDLDKDPKAKDLYRMGTLCTIIQVLRLPDGNMRLLVEGIYRVNINRYYRNKDYLYAYFGISNITTEKSKLEIEALVRSFKKAFMQYINLNKAIPEEALMPLSETVKPADFFYFALANIQFDLKKKQMLFETNDLYESLKELYRIVNEEIQILKLEKKIDGSVKSRLNKLQKEYYLTEQLKAIHKELGITKEDKADLIDFKKKIKETNLSEEAKKKAEEELIKFARLNSFSPEYSVVHTYLSWILDLPWQEPVAKSFDLKKAQQILDDDHYGLIKVKERILEYLAIVKLANKVKG